MFLKFFLCFCRIYSNNCYFHDIFLLLFNFFRNFTHQIFARIFPVDLADFHDQLIKVSSGVFCNRFECLSKAEMCSGYTEDQVLRRDRIMIGMLFHRREKSLVDSV